MYSWILKRSIHVSWLVAVISVGIIAGVFICQYFQISRQLSLLLGITGTVLVIVGLSKRYVYLVPVICVGAVLVGFFRGTIERQQLIQTNQLYGSEVIVRGTIKTDVNKTIENVMNVQLGSIVINNEPQAGTIWMSTNQESDIKRGDEIQAKGTLSPGFGSFSAVIYRAEVQSLIRPQPGDIARVVRDWFADAIRRVISGDAAQLGIGFLVGQKNSLSDELAQALQIAGLTHVVVASGYNLTILVRIARRMFEKISKYLSTLAAGGMIVGFVAMTGLSPSMSRAGLVAGISLLAWYYGRRFHPIVLLTFAACVTVLVNPSYAWGDIGWQLSFVAFAGVMIVAPLLQQFFFGPKKPGLIRQIIGETTAAIILTAPIIVASFGQLSNVAFIANVLVLPFVPLAMLLTFIAGVGALLLPSFSMIIATPATWLLEYIIAVTKYLSELSWATTDVSLSEWGVWACYGVIIVIGIVLWRITRLDLRQTNIIE